MAGPSRYNRKLKAKNDRKKARASRGGRTPSEAALGRSMAAAGNRVSRSNRRATAPRTTPRFGPERKPSTRTFSKGRKARRTSTLAKPPKLPGVLGDIQEAVSGADEAATRFVSRELSKAPKVDVLPDRVEEALDKVLGDDDGRLSYAERLVNAPTGVGLGLTAARTAGKIGTRVATRQAGGTAAKQGTKKTVRRRAKDATRKTKDKPRNVIKKAKRTGKKLRTKEGRGEVGKQVAKTPIRRPLPTTAAYTVGADKAGFDGEATKRASALVEGAVAAPINSPGKYVATTGRGILGVGAAFGAGAYALGNTAVRGARAIADETGAPYIAADYSPGEVVQPATDLAKQEFEGTKELGGRLLSGDKDVVEKTFTDDVGALPFVPGPWLVRKTRGSKTYQRTRSRLRNRASEKVRQERQEATKRATKSDRPMPKADRKGRDKKPKRPRSAILDPLNPGEEYLLSNNPVLRSLGGRTLARKIKRRNIRRGVSQTADMETQIAAKETVFDDQDVQRDIAGISGGPRAGRNKWLGEAEQAAFVVANRGIPFERETALGWIADIERSKTPDTEAVGGVRESRVLEWIRANPEVLSDPSFQSAVQRVGQILDSTTTSQRAKFLPVARVAGIATPEERLAEGVEIRGRLVKETATDPRTWEQNRAKVAQLRAEARQADARGDIEGALEARAAAKALDRRIKNFDLAYRKAGRDFIAETEAFIAERGLRTPARLTDTRRVIDESVGDMKFGNAQFGPRRRNSRATQKSEGVLLREDTADRSRESVWNDSVLGPRLQRVFHGLTKAVIGEYGYKITLPARSGRPRRVLEGTTREHQAALDRGELPDDVMLIDAQYYRAAAGDRNAGSITFDDAMEAISAAGGRLDQRRFGLDDLAGSRADAPGGEMPPVITGGAELRRLAREDRAADPGKKYIAVDREAMMELVGQIEGVRGGLARGAAKLNRGTSNIILGLNPSFIGSQQVAEGGPALVAAATANPASIGRMLATAPNRKRGTNRQRAEREAMYGIAGGTFQFRQPSRGAVIDRVDQLIEPRLTKPSKALGLLKDTFRGRAVNRAVLYTGAKYRRMAGLAELDRRTQRTVGSLGGLVTRFQSLERRFRNKSLAEMEDYFAANPKLRAELKSYVDDVMGNFSTLTRLESRFAPGIAFYPYIRYSLRWAFYAFPRRHPVRASILYFLSQVNAEELEKLVDNGKIADWIDYAYPVVAAAGSGLPYVLPAGGRFTPAGSGPFQSLPLIGEDNPDRLIGSLNPGIGLLLNAGLGRDSFSGEKVADNYLERGLLGAAAFLAMFAPARAIDEATDLDPITRIKPRRTQDGTVIGGQSDSSREFDSFDPNRILRGIAPWGVLYGQSARDYRRTNRKARRMDRGDYSSTQPSNPWGSSSNPWGSSSNPWDD